MYFRVDLRGQAIRWYHYCTAAAIESYRILQKNDESSLQLQLLLKAPLVLPIFRHIRGYIDYDYRNMYKPIKRVKVEEETWYLTILECIPSWQMGDLEAHSSKCPGHY